MRKRNLFQPGASLPFGLSRSKLENFINCPRCFYIDRRLGVEQPGGPPFTINSAVDHLLKKEFDRYRELGEPHPYLTANGIDAVPFRHEKLDEWRENFKGVQYVHEASGFKVSGAVDDLWVHRPSGQIIVADYKATAKDAEVTLDADWQMGYKRQMELYQWLLRRNGFDVSDTGYFVYCNGDRSAQGFDGVVRFKVSLIAYTGNDGWVDDALIRARQCLDANHAPEPGPDCKQCLYVNDIRSLNL